MRLGNHLVVFARSPRLGRVKRRLAADVGEMAAIRFYRWTLASTLARLGRDPRWVCWLAITPDRDVHARGLWPTGWRLIPQGEGDLGRRMAYALRRLPPGPAVIVGADIPDLEASDVAVAFRALGRHAAVFGPAADGGYWLVGLRRRPRPPAIFTGVRWSSPHALADTRRNLTPPLTAALLEVLDDIDDGTALARWRRHAGRRACPRDQMPA